MLLVSIVVPTYNGANKVKRLLEVLSDKLNQIHELIFVVDGSTDNTLEILDSFKYKIKGLKVICQENKGRSSVRNTGARLAEGNLLIFLDDDMLPDNNCILTHISHHKRYKGTLLTGAQIEFLGTHPSDVQKYRISIRQKWTEPLINEKEILLTERNFFITAANFSINKDLFWELGGFDERLTDGEDFDFAFRAFKRGCKIFYNHRAFAFSGIMILYPLKLI